MKPCTIAVDLPAMTRALWVDRQDAGARLAARLAAYAGANTLVLGIPRGGLVVAAEVARRLGAELDVIAVNTLHAPQSRDVVIGAVTANGGRFLNMDAIYRHRVSPAIVAAITQMERGAALGRDAWLRTFRPAAAVFGRTIIIVDDGMQTGATMCAAATALRRKLPARVIAAAPVGSQRSCAAVLRHVDELVCLEQTQRVVNLDRCYRDFAPPGEAEMRELLEGGSLMAHDFFTEHVGGSGNGR
jgi:predicted phosphoribosyltransferase